MSYSSNPQFQATENAFKLQLWVENWNIMQSIIKHQWNIIKRQEPT